MYMKCFVNALPISIKEELVTLFWGMQNGTGAAVCGECYTGSLFCFQPSVFNTDQNKANLLTPLYGLWQTEEYKPPPAVDVSTLMLINIRLAVVPSYLLSAFRYYT